MLLAIFWRSLGRLHLKTPCRSTSKRCDQMHYRRLNASTMESDLSPDLFLLKERQIISVSPSLVHRIGGSWLNWAMILGGRGKGACKSVAMPNHCSLKNSCRGKPCIPIVLHNAGEQDVAYFVPGWKASTYFQIRWCYSVRRSVQ